MNTQHLNGKIQNRNQIENGMIMMKMILVMLLNKIGEVKYLKVKKKNLNLKNIVNVKVRQ